MPAGAIAKAIDGLNTAGPAAASSVTVHDLALADDLIDPKATPLRPRPGRHGTPA